MSYCGHRYTHLVAVNDVSFAMLWKRRITNNDTDNRFSSGFREWFPDLALRLLKC